MNSSKALVGSRMVTFGLTNLLKYRGMKQFRMDDMYYKPGSSTQEPSSRRTWADEEHTQQPEGRLDDTKYSPGRWTERKYQATWREPKEVEMEEPQEEVKEPVCQEKRSAAPPALRRSLDTRRRLQRISIPASRMISQFISTQNKNKKLRVEAAADRTSYDYPLA
ncbi:uncharacterized protein LOC108113511 [Drosophila eugracilis]|uniref:uncharacterized protein LOC108113511 n=1 Tax=Drosophila eugracilis TaxID=29029 RepID=UPI0007E5D366|nr:uncharacterized protein LOC108113511 [Drosophila eugracilis]